MADGAGISCMVLVVVPRLSYGSIFFLLVIGIIIELQGDWSGGGLPI